MGTVMSQYDVAKMEELQVEIQEKENQLFKEISDALARGDNITYLHLKQMQIQCSAELRLIKHIKDGFKDNFVIC